MTDPIVVVLDGLDGSGKSTLVPGLVEWLAKKRQRTAVSFRDPGSTPLGEKIRALVKNADEPMTQQTQFLLFCAARAELAAKVNVHLARGDDVVLDRWWYSTFAYQGALGIPSDLIIDLSKATAKLDTVIGGVHAFYLHVSPDVARKRIADDAVARQSTFIKDRFESMDETFRQTVHIRYLQLTAGGYMKTIDTDPRTPHEVFVELTRKLSERPELW